MYNVTSVLDDRVETLGAFLHIIPKLIPGDKFWTSIFFYKCLQSQSKKHLKDNC